MAKQVTGFLKLQIRGGGAKPGAPVGPALGSKGLSIMDFCNQFNARTQEKKGDLLPVVIKIYADKSFDFDVKSPPAAALIMKAANFKKGSAEPNRTKVAALTWEQAIEIGKIKMDDLNAFDEVSAAKIVAGTARSMGVTMKGSIPAGAK